MSNKRKNFGRGGERFVQIADWLMKTEAWETMPPGPRALYLELKRHFDGRNNGEIFLSHRDAASALNINRETAGRYFHELEERGFIAETNGHHLGPAGIGQATRYRLTEMPYAGASATLDFKKWQREKQNPRRKIRPPMAGKSGHGGRKSRHEHIQMSENPAALALKAPSAMSENPAIVTSTIYPAPAERVARLLASGLGFCGKASQGAICHA